MRLRARIGTFGSRAYRHGAGVAVYLSRYVRGGPIKDSRLVTADEGSVQFRYEDVPDGQRKVMGLATAPCVSMT